MPYLFFAYNIFFWTAGIVANIISILLSVSSRRSEVISFFVCATVVVNLVESIGVIWLLREGGSSDDGSLAIFWAAVFCPLSIYYVLRLYKKGRE